MKKITIISLVVLFSACVDDDIKTSVKTCLNEVYSKQSNEIYDKCFYYQNEFQRQLLINFNQTLPKIFEQYKGVKNINVDVIEANKNSGIVNIITEFNNGFITNEKRKVIKLNNEWKIDAQTIN